MNSKTIIIAAIAVILLVLGGIVIAQNTTPKENVTAYDVNLKNADFKYFDIKVPEGSNFTIKNIMNESDKGMVYWKNTGNFTKEVEGIIINKNMTDKLIPISMDLINKNGTEKVYHSNGGYQIVKTMNNTDLILIGSDLHVLNEMLDSVKIKNTDNITSPKAKENTTPVKKVIKTVEKPKPKPEPKKTEDTRKKTSGQIYIGGGIFKTGSGLDDKTNAKIYIDGGHPGESIIIKIKYYRDGNSLNVGNMVTATIGDDGYVNINSADAYTHYPDQAYIELYDLDGNLQCTQTVTLNPDSSTQFF